jgi:anthranilate synthase component 1
VNIFGFEVQTKNKSQVEFKKIETLKTPTEIFSANTKKFEHGYLLESVIGPSKLAEYSFLGFNPTKIISFRGNKVTFVDQETGEVKRIISEDPITQVRTIINSRRIIESNIRLLGGAVGYLSYDSIRYWEDIPANTEDDTKYPDGEFGIYEDGIIFNHKTNEKYYYHFGNDRSKYLDFDKVEELAPLRYSDPEWNVDKSEYEEMVLKAKEYIIEGDIFQTVLSRRFQVKIKGDSHNFYNILRKINPSPYMYHIKMGQRRIIGSSPEMLIRVEKNNVETFPIAGSRPRESDPKKNLKLAEDLLSDAKDRAEHIMLVDLARNDLGKISEFGTVKTVELMKVQEYSHVQHIVSHVKGRMKSNYDAFDALKAVFPAGTVSGAPKIRAMEIIDELEPTRRGPYAGAVGYFSFNGNADFAISIRTLTINGNRAQVQAGAGIVADSNPEKEWLETKDKANALLRALDIAQDDNSN